MFHPFPVRASRNLDPPLSLLVPENTPGRDRRNVRSPLHRDLLAFWPGRGVIDTLLSD